MSKKAEKPKPVPAQPSLASISLAPSSAQGGTAVIGTATLTGAAPSGGALVTLAPSPTASATIPASVTVPAGQVSATFQVLLATVTTASTVTIYGNYGPGNGTTCSGSVTVTPPSTPAPPPAGTPTFVDDFNTGTLDTTKWQVSNYEVNNYAGGGSNVTFSSANVSLSQGMLCLTLNQGTAGSSTGAELQSVETFGYGTFEMVMRMGNTSPTANGAGAAVSGSDSSMFVFVNNSQTELDIEFCGNTPNEIWLTNWVNPTPANAPTLEDSTQPAISGLDTGFHTYTMVWTPGQVQWSIDGNVVATHTQNVPSTPAYIMFNFWGTNSTQWGGIATVGVNRYQYVQSISYTPYQA